MNRIDDYRQELRGQADWLNYLCQHSGLPGPRGNIELARAFSLEGCESDFQRLLAYNAAIAPTNTAGEFLAFCGVLGMGVLLAGGRKDLLETIRCAANDPRWRVREAAAMALQNVGRADFSLLLDITQEWSSGAWLEQRAAAAGLCEPVLLKGPLEAGQTLNILDTITSHFLNCRDCDSEDARVLRQGLAYCWSVAVAAAGEAGKARMERWMENPDRNVRWIMKQNLTKKRLEKMDASWVAAWREKLQ